MAPRRKNKGKKNFKKNYRKHRARVTETKRRESAEISIRNSTNGAGVTFSPNYLDTTAATDISVGTGITMLPLRSFYRMSRGQRKNQMIGTQIYAKDLYLKGFIDSGKNHPGPDLTAEPLYLVCGWVKDKLGFTDFTTPTQANATRTDLEAFVAAQLRQHFDSAEDKLRYREAKKDNIKIDKYQRLLSPPGLDAGNAMPLQFKAHWKVNRKTTYTQCTSLPGLNDLIQNSSASPGVTIDMTDQLKDSNDTLGGDIGGYLPLESWLPFSCLYQPGHLAHPTNAPYSVQFNDILYFTG